MKREVCCDKCAERWGAAGKRPHGEEVKKLAGAAKGPFVCDGCAVPLEEGSLVTCVSVLARDQQYQPWEHNFVDTDPSFEDDSAERLAAEMEQIRFCLPCFDTKIGAVRRGDGKMVCDQCKKIPPEGQTMIFINGMLATAVADNPAIGFEDIHVALLTAVKAAFEDLTSRAVLTPREAAIAEHWHVFLSAGAP